MGNFWVVPLLLSVSDMTNLTRWQRTDSLSARQRRRHRTIRTVLLRGRETKCHDPPRQVVLAGCKFGLQRGRRTEDVGPLRHPLPSEAFLRVFRLNVLCVFDLAYARYLIHTCYLPLFDNVHNICWKAKVVSVCVYCPCEYFLIHPQSSRLFAQVESQAYCLS
jgi:hypothetical protein